MGKNRKMNEDLRRAFGRPVEEEGHSEKKEWADLTPVQALGQLEDVLLDAVEGAALLREVLEDLPEKKEERETPTVGAKKKRRTGEPSAPVENSPVS